MRIMERRSRYEERSERLLYGRAGKSSVGVGLSKNVSDPCQDSDSPYVRRPADFDQKVVDSIDSCTMPDPRPECGAQMFQPFFEFIQPLAPLGVQSHCPGIHHWPDS